MNYAMNMANIMARSPLTPSHLYEEPGYCLLVVEKAICLGVSPFALARSTSVISGELVFGEFSYE